MREKLVCEMIHVYVRQARQLSLIKNSNLGIFSDT